MPAEVQDEIFEILPSPSWGTPQKRTAPKLRFQAAAGYTHQRERYSHARFNYPLKWPLLTEAEFQTLQNWLDSTGSATFWFLPPTALWSGIGSATVRLCRIVSDEVSITPVAYGLYSVEITLEEV